MHRGPAPRERQRHDVGVARGASTVPPVNALRAGSPVRLALVLESNTDIRLVHELEARYELTVLARYEQIAEFPPAVGPDLEVGPSRRVGYFAWLLRRLAWGECPFDVVIAQNYAVAALAANLAAVLSRVPTLTFVCNPMEAYYRCRRTDPGSKFRRSELLALEALARGNARVAHRYVVLSEHLAATVRAHGARCPVDVIPVYGVDTAVFQPAAEGRTELRAQLNLPEAGKLILFGSRVAAEKDWRTLLAAFRELAANRDVWLVHLGRERGALVAAARKLGIGERVIAREMANPTTDLAAYYQACDLCVQASREEGLGFTPLEALACELPVVAARAGGLSETVVENETGLTYAPGDPAELRAKLEQALADPALASRLARAGRRLVTQRYATAPAFASLDRVIREVTSSRAR